MSLWKDIYVARPDDGAPIYVRRSLAGTPDIWGFWNAASALLVCGWQLRDSDIWNWKPAPGLLPPFPVPSVPAHWSDPWLTPPLDGQLCWVRRFSPLTHPTRATWSLSRLGFLPETSSQPIPWQNVWHWKPRPS